MTQNSTNLNTQRSFTLQLEFLSDWHVGSGTGRPGDVDRLVQRDRHNLPYIPAKTLTGIWRDACERVAYGLDNGVPDGIWQQWVMYLFGDQPADLNRPVEKAEHRPRPAALSIRTAHFPEDLNAALIAKPKLHDLISIIKPGIKIDLQTGCAEPDCLRMEERVRGGAVLTAVCTLAFDSAMQSDACDTAYALLIAGAQFLERLEGKRRRGAGKCRATVLGESANDWIGWIEGHSQPPLPPEPEETNQSLGDDHTEILNSGDTWVCFDLAIEARSPLVIAARSIGNVVESLDYIPGSHLLGLILKTLRKGGLLNSTTIQQAIAQKSLVITPATIEVEEQAGRPVPLCWEADKQAGGLRKGGQVYNRFAESDHIEDLQETENLQLKGERGYYIGPSAVGESQKPTLPASAVVSKGIATHNVVEDRVQRPTEDVGGVFSYEAIAPNTKLRAQLRLRYTLAHQIKQAYLDQQTEEPKSSDWWLELKGEHRVGTSKKDDYGAVDILVSGGQLPNAYPTKHELYVWLLSDALIRDKRLRFSTQVEDLADVLSDALGLERTDKAQSPLKYLKAKQQTSRVESWQVQWGLPRPSLVGIKAGSCFVFQSDQEIPDKQLQRVQTIGIGDRTAEGYGQLSFNDPLITNPTSDLKSAKASEPQTSDEDPPLLLANQSDGFAYARIIEREAWRDAIRRRSLELAADSDTREQYLALQSTNPPNSQLGALNSTLRQLRSTDASDKQTILQWMTHIRETSNRFDKWKVGDNSPALSKIETLITDQTQIWNLLTPRSPDGAQPDPDFWPAITLTASGNNELREELWAEAVRVFIDAFIRSHRREMEETNEAEKQSTLQGATNNG